MLRTSTRANTNDIFFMLFFLRIDLLVTNTLLLSRLKIQFCIGNTFILTIQRMFSCRENISRQKHLYAALPDSVKAFPASHFLCFCLSLYMCMQNEFCDIYFQISENFLKDALPLFKGRGLRRRLLEATVLHLEYGVRLLGPEFRRRPSAAVRHRTGGRIAHRESPPILFGSSFPCCRSWQRPGSAPAPPSPPPSRLPDRVPGPPY